MSNFNYPRYSVSKGGQGVAEIEATIPLTPGEIWQVANLMDSLWGDRVDPNNAPIFVTGGTMEEIEEPE